MSIGLLIKFINHSKSVSTALILISVTFAEPVFAHASLHELIDYTTELIRGQPDNTAALLGRAKLHLRKGDSVAALSDIETAEQQADRVEVSYVLGLYFVATTQHQQAILAFGDFLARYPGHTPSIHGRAKAFTRLGHTEKAIYDYQYLLNVSQNPSPDYYLELAELESSLAHCGIHLAIKTLDRGIERLGPIVGLQSAAIEFEIELGNTQQALSRHRTLKPWLGNTALWNNRQKILSEKLLAETTRSEVTTQ